jgi:glutathione S-transferase
MINLYSFGANLGVMDPSPFVVKVDVFLRMNNLPYQVKKGAHYLKKSPKGKLPFISIKKDEETLLVSDSQHIIEYLIKANGLNLDDALTAEQKAQMYLFSKALDESLYWCLVYSRWVLEDTWPVSSKAFFGRMPLPLRLIVPTIYRKKVIKNLHSQGFGRHNTDELLVIADNTFSALSVILGEKNYFYGKKPCSFDAVVYALLCQFITTTCTNVFNDKARSYPNLVSFCQRIEKQFY